MNPNVVVRYLPSYRDADGRRTAFTIDGGHVMEYVGVVDGQENVPMYRRDGGRELYTGAQASAAALGMQLVQAHADLPPVGGTLYCWWPRGDGFAAGFYRCTREQ